jgi:hypothetical protein
MTVDVQKSNERIIDSLVCVDNEGPNVFVQPLSYAPTITTMSFSEKPALKLEWEYEG